MLRLASRSLLYAIFAFSSVVYDFYNYYNNCGTIFFGNTTLPHPVVTPCFYGAFGFLFTLVLSYKIFKTKNLKIQKYLVALCSFGTAFAWSNMALEIKKYILANGQQYIGCSGAKISNPFFTACFVGSVLFAILLIVAYKNFKYLKSK